MTGAIFRVCGVYDCEAFRVANVYTMPFHSIPFQHESSGDIMFKRINCEVFPGMFPSEHFVPFKDADGNDFGYMFADDQLVRVLNPCRTKTRSRCNCAFTLSIRQTAW